MIEKTDIQTDWHTFDRYRDYIKHQYDLTNHRTTWFVTITSFLIAAFAFTLHKKADIMVLYYDKGLNCSSSIALCQTIRDADIFMVAITIIGSYSSLIALILLESARYPISQIARKWDEISGLDKIDSEYIVKHLRDSDTLLLVGGLSRRAAFWGRVTAPMLPIIVIIGWFCIGVFSSYSKSSIDAHGDWSIFVRVILSFPIAAILVNLSLYFAKFRIIPNPNYG